VGLELQYFAHRKAPKPKINALKKRKACLENSGSGEFTLYNTGIDKTAGSGQLDKKALAGLMFP
jgi:hypothetical protein